MNCERCGQEMKDPYTGVTGLRLGVCQDCHETLAGEFEGSRFERVEFEEADYGDY